MQDRTEMNREEPEQTYGFTVVPGSGQDSSALQEKLRAMPGVTGAEVSELQGRDLGKGPGVARTVQGQAIIQSGDETTGGTDVSRRGRTGVFLNRHL